MIGVVFVIAVSRAISVLMQSTGLDQYVLAYASQTLGDVSPVLFVVTGYVIYLGLSFLIPSTSGLAAVSMPTFGGLAAELGFRPEVMIMIFCAASGLVNLVTPTSAVVMGGLSICRIELDHLAEIHRRLPGDPIGDQPCGTVRGHIYSLNSYKITLHILPELW